MKGIPRKNLVFGALFFVVGGALLLRTLGILPRLVALWPVLIILLGLYLLYRTYVLGGPESLIFYGIFSTLVGTFFLILNTEFVPFSVLRNIWPIFMVFVGSALLLYGVQLKGNSKTRFVVPAIGILVLSLVFFPFSLGWVRIRLKDVIIRFWPLILMFSGLFLILFDFFRNKIFSKKE
ncbi:MAG: hypothetical protein SNJ78_02820 [Spirochaetales bacterium]